MKVRDIHSSPDKKEVKKEVKKEAVKLPPITQKRSQNINFEPIANDIEL
jgi:hypothetical protein